MALKGMLQAIGGVSFSMKWDPECEEASICMANFLEGITRYRHF